MSKVFCDERDVYVNVFGFIFQKPNILQKDVNWTLIINPTWKGSIAFLISYDTSVKKWKTPINNRFL